MSTDALNGIMGSGGTGAGSSAAVDGAVARGGGGFVSGGGGLASWSNLLSLGASALGGAGSIAGGFQQSAAQRYNAALYSTEAAIAERNAAAEAVQVQQQSRRRIGAALAAAGASGIDPNQGSPVNVLADLASQGELSRQLVLYRGSLDAAALRQRATLSRYYATQATDTGIAAGSGTLLTGYLRFLKNRGPLTPGSSDDGTGS